MYMNTIAIYVVGYNLIQRTAVPGPTLDMHIDFPCCTCKGHVQA